MRKAKQNNRVLMRDACEKAWGSMTEAVNALFLKKAVEKLPKSHRERRLLLMEIEGKDKKLASLHLLDRFMAKDHALHMRGFYNGDIDPDEVRENFKKVRNFIEEVENL